MSLAFIDPEINAFEFHDLDKDMSNIPDGSTEKSNHEIHQNFVIFGLSIVENNRVTHFREKIFPITKKCTLGLRPKVDSYRNRVLSFVSIILRGVRSAFRRSV